MESSQSNQLPGILFHFYRLELENLNIPGRGQGVDETRNWKQSNSEVIECPDPHNIADSGYSSVVFCGFR